MSGTCCHLMRRRTMRQQKGKVWYQCKGTSSHCFGQKDKEPVANYVFRLEHMFQVAYGKESISTETRDMFAQSQLQEGLSYELMQSPVVSGAVTYPELCMLGGQEWREEAGHTGTMPQAPTQQPECCHSLQSDEIVIQHSEFHIQGCEHQNLAMCTYYHLWLICIHSKWPTLCSQQWLYQRKSSHFMSDVQKSIILLLHVFGLKV